MKEKKATIFLCFVMLYDSLTYLTKWDNLPYIVADVPFCRPPGKQRQPLQGNSSQKKVHTLAVQTGVSVSVLAPWTTHVASGHALLLKNGLNHIPLSLIFFLG